MKIVHDDVSLLGHKTEDCAQRIIVISSGSGGRGLGKGNGKENIGEINK